MNVQKRHLPLFEIKPVCYITDVLPKTNENGNDAKVAVLTPVGTGAVFWLECSRPRTELEAAKGQFAYVNLVGFDVSIKSSDASCCAIVDLSGAKPSMATKTDTFVATGQYFGFDGNHVWVKSEFLLGFEPVSSCYFQIGDWVSVQGRFQVDWSPHDVLVYSPKGERIYYPSLQQRNQQGL